MPRSGKKPDKPTGKKPGVKITDAEWDKFFAEVVAAGGNVSRACETCKISRVIVYHHRKVDPAFEERFKEAEALGADVLEDEAIRRAFEGVDEPVGFFRGVASQYKRTYSDSLIQFLLKAKKPEKFRERVSTENVNFNGNLDEDKELKERLRAKLLG